VRPGSDSSPKCITLVTASSPHSEWVRKFAQSPAASPWLMTTKLGGRNASHVWFDEMRERPPSTGGLRLGRIRPLTAAMRRTGFTSGSAGSATRTSPASTVAATNRRVESGMLAISDLEELLATLACDSTPTTSTRGARTAIPEPLEILERRTKLTF
jgi:hypothetical protein